jgi:2,4-dienoyl-CoA reductase (NADPH2)
MRLGEGKYPHIFSPGRIGKIETKNRIEYASTETNFNYWDGYVTDKEVAYMKAQARGGAGIVTTQGAYTNKVGAGRGYAAIHDSYSAGMDIDFLHYQTFHREEH